MKFHCQLWYDRRIDDDDERSTRKGGRRRKSPKVLLARGPRYLWNGKLPPGDSPHMLECSLPKRIGSGMGGMKGSTASASDVSEVSVPVAVSITQQPCDAATNVLRVYGGGGGDEKGKNKKKKDFAVCLKFLSVTHMDRRAALRWVATSQVTEFRLHPFHTKKNPPRKIGGVVGAAEDPGCGRGVRLRARRR